jgi:hypothetical protein
METLPTRTGTGSRRNLGARTYSGRQVATAGGGGADLWLSRMAFADPAFFLKGLDDERAARRRGGVRSRTSRRR